MHRRADPGEIQAYLWQCGPMFNPGYQLMMPCKSNLGQKGTVGINGGEHGVNKLKEVPHQVHSIYAESGHSEQTWFRLAQGVDPKA